MDFQSSSPTQKPSDFAQGFSLSKAESRIFFQLAERGTRFFTVKDVESLETGISRKEVNGLLSKLEKKGRVRRIERGKYLFSPPQSGLDGSWAEHEFAVADFIAPKPYYLSYYSALFHWKATDQIPRTVFVVTNRQKKPVVFNGVTYKFICKKTTPIRMPITSSWTTATFSGRNVNIATKEQALLDCLEHPEYCGGVVEAARLLQPRMGLVWQVIEREITRAKSAVQRRLAYLMDLTGTRNELWWKLDNQRFVGYRLLDPSRSKQGTYSKKYGLQLNVDKQELVFEALQ